MYRKVRLLLRLNLFVFMFSGVLAQADQAQVPAAPVCENAQADEESLTSLRKKGAAFFGTAKNEAKTETQKVSIDRLQTVRSSRQLSKQVTACSKIIEDKKVSQEAKQALMVGIGTKMCTMLRNQIIHIIETIKTNVSYWYDQKDHTAVRYYLQRAPRHWLSRKAAKNEVRDNIAKLECLQDAYFVALHKITQCRDACNEKASAQEQEKWLDQLMDACAQVPYIKNALLLEDGLVEGDDHFTRMRTIIAVMPEYERLVAQDLGYARMPHHLVRNWLGYLAAGLVTYYVYRKRDAIADRASSLGNNLYAQNIEPLWKKFEHAFIKKKPDDEAPEGRPEEGVDRKKVYDDAAFEVQVGLAELSQAIPEPGGPGFSRAELVRRYKDAVSVVQGAGYRMPEDFNLDRAAGNLDTHQLDKILHIGFTEVLPRAFQVKKLQVASEFVPLLPLQLAIEKYKMQNLISDMADGLHRGSGLIGSGLSKYAGQVTKDTAEGFDKVDRVMEQNELTLAATAVSPLLVMGFGALKGLKWAGSKLMPKNIWVEYNHASTRVAVQELHRIFSLPENEQAKDVVQGKKFFNLECLKRDAREYLHGSKQQGFIQDVRSLETAPDPLAVINRMWSTYEFLSPSYKV